MKPVVKTMIAMLKRFHHNLRKPLPVLHFRLQNHFDLPFGISPDKQRNNTCAVSANIDNGLARLFLDIKQTVWAAARQGNLFSPT